MGRKKMVACRVSIIVAAMLCLVISTGLFISGLEAIAQNVDLLADSLNVKYPLFYGALGISFSVFSLINEGFVSGRRHSLFSAIGAFFLIYQGLHVLEFSVMTNGWYIVIAFGIPILVFSMLGLIFNDLLGHASQ